MKILSLKRKLTIICLVYVQKVASSLQSSREWGDWGPQDPIEHHNWRQWREDETRPITTLKRRLASRPLTYTHSTLSSESSSTLTRLRNKYQRNGAASVLWGRPCRPHTAGGVTLERVEPMSLSPLACRHSWIIVWSLLSLRWIFVDVHNASTVIRREREREGKILLLSFEITRRELGNPYRWVEHCVQSSTLWKD